MDIIKHGLVIKLLYFLFGVLITLTVTLRYNKEKIIYYLNVIKNKFKRFIKNIVNQPMIILVLFISYIFFNILGYGEDALPEIIGTGASIFIINFFIEEREYDKKKDLNKLLNYKMKEICDISNKMLLEYINFNDYDTVNINSELLINIFNTQDLLSQTMTRSYIDTKGEFIEEDIIKIDYPFFIAKELNPIVKQLTSNYGQYLDYNQIMTLIELEEMLNKRIFKGRISLMGEVRGSIPEKYIVALAESLNKLNGIVAKLDIRS